MTPDLTTDEWYRVIGRFVVKFEHACQATRILIMLLLPGGDEAAQAMKITLLAPLGAKQLKDSLHGMLERSGKLDAEARTVLAKFDELITKRNQIVHSAWKLEPSDEFGKFGEVMRAMTPSRKQSGPHWSARQLTEEDAAHAVVLADEVYEGLQELFVNAFPHVKAELG